MSNLKYLDKTGLSYFWGKVKGIVSPKADKVSSPTSGHLAGLNSSGNITDSGISADDVKNAVSLTYSQLKSLRDNSQLIPGKLYRITDYVATTIDAESRSASHPFDILVFAKDESHIFEEGGAALHSGDTYFANTKFQAWRVWYCLDNDTTRFDWADTTNGKGVVYRLIDEWENDIPYDFKGIQFKRYKVTAASGFTDYLSGLNGLYIGLSGTQSYGLDIDSSDYKWYYTFSKLGSTFADEIVDDSILGTGSGMTKMERTAYDSEANSLNNNVFANGVAVENFMKSINANYEGIVSEICDNASFGMNANNNTILGPISNLYAESQFRKNIIVGVFRHHDISTDFEYNTIAVGRDNAFCVIAHYVRQNVVFIEGALLHINVASGCYGNKIKTTDSVRICSLNPGFLNNTIVSSCEIWGVTTFSFEENIITASSLFNNIIFGSSFRNNTIVGSVYETEFKSNVYQNVFGGANNNIALYRSVIGQNFGQNECYGTIMNCKFFGQIINCSFNGPINACNFDAFLQYITVPAGTNSTRFAAVDVKGNIRGASNSGITLNDSRFRLASVGGISRRVTIEGQANGDIVATWKENGMVTGIKTSDKGATWTSLPPIGTNIKDLSLYDYQQHALILRETANTYIVPRTTNAWYKIPLVYGNGIHKGEKNPAAYTRQGTDYTADFVNHLGNTLTSPFIEENTGCVAASCGLLWQTSAQFIDSVGIEDGVDCRYLRFHVNSPAAVGSDAVLYVKDANNDIIWSWMIWAPASLLSVDRVTNYTGVHYDFLSENLGALVDNTSYRINPHYQWGRKDPMCPPAAYNSTSNLTLYDISGNTYSGFGVLGTDGDQSAQKTVANAIKNPNLFFVRYDTTIHNWNNLSWFNNFWNAAMTDSGDLADNQATAIKTIYDPCPAGFMLPAGRAWTGFTTTGSNTSTASEFNVIGSFSAGWNFKKDAQDTVGTYYPASGCRRYGSGGLGSVGSYGYCWAFAPYSQTYARYLYFYSGGVLPLNGTARALGFSVRPSRELT